MARRKSKRQKTKRRVAEKSSTRPASVRLYSFLPSIWLRLICLLFLFVLGDMETEAVDSRDGRRRVMEISGG